MPLDQRKTSETDLSLFAISSGAAAVGRYYELALGKVYTIGFLEQIRRQAGDGDGDGDGEIRL